ncbi:bifunctional hydroxymethylpyrimidine kinase/phosphomethylpyrimidine kinase [Pseudohongiella sp.]|uniref:Pyridoxamine kinase/Phosphomethylpyrimidine kinase domain-containing protein n=1 Tax=marine sediment metagenome TaxID=412755 RepID=A0A0F9VSL4_9ZZZZ|nr:hydroxymethylpyrimidine/phosphomethylpyrimidine kinase [Pseudohongiella sp.]HDZ10268.1 hydroxymethylpyrimidine/phosphomethylpyrimidine kinase [Pseudohongiella sp.]HEA64248.1 hydroxymethylpyrimidine/phosphomethylpyrimidine kinase [Pseudohongiella sp.]
MAGKPAVLCLSGLDPSGGAGIQADIETLFANGCHCLPVITSLTVQDTCNVSRTQTVGVDVLRAQISTVFADIQVHAIKIGLIDNIDVLRLIAEVMTDHPAIPVVADPVVKAGGGFEFSGAELIAAYRSLILPRVTVLTPNTDELLALSPDCDHPERAASALMDLGCRHILLTGTHASTPDVVNTLYHPDAPAESWTWPRLPGSFHGSGCTLAAALAAGLAQTIPLSQAAANAQAFTWQALQHGWRAGQGQFLPDRRGRNR